MHRYEQIAQIGKGSFGVVYKCRLKQTGQFVAVKQISTYGKSSSELAALNSEISLLKEINHPNTIRFFESFEEDGSVVIVTELAQSDLYSIFASDGPLNIETIQKVCFQLLNVLTYLHSRRIAHRDIKSQNVLISQGICKLCDFGFARQMSQQTLALQSIKGTPLYLAPEIAKGKKYNIISDMWAFGVMIFELATGRTPFTASDFLTLMNILQDDSNKVPYDKYSIFAREPLFKNFCECMLQRNPDKRWSSKQMLDHPFLSEGSAIRLAKHVNDAYKFKDWFSLLRTMKQQSALQSILLNVNTEAVVEVVEQGALTEEYADNFYDNRLIDAINEAINSTHDLPPIVIALMALLSINSNQSEAIFTSEVVSSHIHSADSRNLEKDYYRILAYIHSHPGDKDEAFYRITDFIAFLIVRSSSIFLQLIQSALRYISKANFVQTDVISIVLILRVAAVCFGCMFTWNVPISFGQIVSFPYDMYIMAEDVVFPSKAEDKPALTKRAHIVAAAINTLSATGTIEKLFESFNTIISKSIGIIETSTESFVIKCFLYCINVSFCMGTTAQSSVQFLMQEYVLYLPSGNRMIGLEHLLVDDYVDADMGSGGDEEKKAPGGDRFKLRTIDVRYDVNIRNSLFGQIDTRDYNKFRFLPEYFKKFTTSEKTTEISADLFGEDEYSYVGIFLSENFKVYINRFVDLISGRCARDYPILLTRLYVIFKRLINFKNGIKLDEGYITIYNNYTTTCLQTLFQIADTASQADPNNVMQAAIATIIKNLNLPILSVDSSSAGVLKYTMPSLGQTIGKTAIGDVLSGQNKTSASTPREGRTASGEGYGYGPRTNLDMLRAGSIAMSMAAANIAGTNQSVSMHALAPVSAIYPTVEFALILLHLRQTLLQNHQAIVNMFTVRMPAKMLSTGKLSAIYAYYREPYCFNLEVSKGTDMAGVTIETYQGSTAMELNNMVSGRSKTEMSILLNSENTFLIEYLNAFKKQLAMCYCFLPFAYIQSDEQEVFKQLNSSREEFRRIVAEKEFVETQLSKKFHRGSVIEVQNKIQTDAGTIDSIFTSFVRTVLAEIKSLKLNSFRFLKHIFAPSFQYLFPLYTYSRKDPSPLAHHALYMKRRFQQSGIPNGDDINLNDIKNNDIKTLVKLLIQAELPRRGHFIITIPQVCYIFDGMSLPGNPFSIQIFSDPFSTFSLYQTNVNLVSTYMILSECIRMVVEEAFLNGLLVLTTENDVQVCQISNVVVQKYIDIHVIFATSTDGTIPPSDYLYQGLPVCAYVNVKQGEGGTDKIFIDKNAQLDYLDREDVRVNALLTLYNCAFCSEDYARNLSQITFPISDVITENKDETKLSVITMLAISCLWLQAHGEEDDLRLSLFGLLLTSNFEYNMTCLQRDSEYLVKLYKPDSLSTIKDLLLLSLVKRISIFADSVEESLAEARLIMDGSSYKRVDDVHTKAANDTVISSNPQNFNILSHGALRVERIMKELIKVGGIIDYGHSDFNGGFDRYNYPKLTDVNIDFSVRQLRRSYYYLSTGTAIEVPSINNYLELEVPVPVFYACIDAITPILKHCKDISAKQPHNSSSYSLLASESREKVVVDCIDIAQALFASLDYVLVEPSFRAFLMPCHNYMGFLDSALSYINILTREHIDVLSLFVKLSIYLNLSLYNSIEAAFCAAYAAPHHGAILGEEEPETSSISSAVSSGTPLFNTRPAEITTPNLTPSQSLKLTSRPPSYGAPTPAISEHDTPEITTSRTTARSKASLKMANYSSKPTILYEQKSETGYPIISTYLGPGSKHYNGILMCNLINNCSDCMADCLGLDTRRYDLGGLEGRNQEISNANWHWRFLASPQGIINYVISVRNTLSLLANKHVSGLTDPPGDVNYNSAGWTTIRSIEEFNQYMSYPLPEVMRILCTAISPQSLDNIILCPYQFGGGQRAAESLMRHSLLAIYQIVYLSCRPNTENTRGSVEELRKAGNAVKKEKHTDMARFVYDPGRYYMTEYVSSVLLEFNFIKHVIDSLYYLRSAHTLYYALVIMVFFVMHPQESIVIPWINQFIFSGGVSMNLLSAIFSQKNVSQRNNPHTCILELLILLLRAVQVSQEYAELVSNTIYASTIIQFLSFESSEDLIVKSCEFVGYLIKARPTVSEQYKICLDSLIELIKTRRTAIVTKSLFAMTHIAKTITDAVALSKCISCVCKTLMNARVLDDIKTCAAVASAKIVLAHEELATEFVSGEGVISLIDCMSNCDQLSDKMIYAKSLLELTKFDSIVTSIKSQASILRMMDRDCDDDALKSLLDSLLATSKKM